MQLPSEPVMSTTEVYTLLQSVIAFRESYKSLQKVYDSNDNADLRELYPLGQIDLFDDNTKNAIVAWLNHHSTKLMGLLPDKVLNPVCIPCLLENGPCKLTLTGACSIKPDCVNYPYITYDRNMIANYIDKQTYFAGIVVPKGADDTAVRTIYHNLLTKLEIQEDVSK